MESLSSRQAIEGHQLKRLGRMLRAILPTNELYRKKLPQEGIAAIDSLEKFKRLPFTTKNELVED